MPLFFGYGYPLLTVAGLLLARRNLTRARCAVLAAYGATFLTLVLLRGTVPILRDIKETTFVGPLVALTTGYALETLAARGPREKAVAWLIAIALAAFGLWKYAQYLEPALLLPAST